MKAKKSVGSAGPTTTAMVQEAPPGEKHIMIQESIHELQEAIERLNGLARIVGEPNNAKHKKASGSHEPQGRGGR